MEFGVYPFSVIGVFIASDSMHKSILCKSAVPHKLGLEIKHYFTIISDYFTLLSFIFSASTVDDFFVLVE